MRSKIGIAVVLLASFVACNAEESDLAEPVVIEPATETRTVLDTVEPRVPETATLREHREETPSQTATQTAAQPSTMQAPVERRAQPETPAAQPSPSAPQKQPPATQPAPPPAERPASQPPPQTQTTATTAPAQPAPATPSKLPRTHTVDLGGTMHAPGMDNPVQRCGACHGKELKGGRVADVSCFSCHEQKW